MQASLVASSDFLGKQGEEAQQCRSDRFSEFDGHRLGHRLLLFLRVSLRGPVAMYSS